MKLLIYILIMIFLTPTSFSQESYCDYKVEILLNESIFDIENFTWRMKATKMEGIAANITGTAQIEDSENNIIKSYKPWTNEPISKQKTSGQYSPNLKPNEYKITARIDVNCNDTDKSNNIDLKSIKIESAVQQSTKPKEVVVANEINNSANENTEMQPIDDKNIDAQEIQYQQNETKVQQTQQPTPDEYEDNIIHLKTQSIDEENNTIIAAAVKQQIVYESSNERAKELIMYFLLGLSILLNIILLWRR